MATLTYLGADGAVLNRRQFLGHVVEPAPGAAPGVYVAAPGGEVLALPADPAAVLPAPRGQYRCLVSDETFTDPDWLTSWRIHAGQDPAGWDASYAPHVHPAEPPEWEFIYRHDPAHLRRLLDTHAAAYLNRRVQVFLQLYIEKEAGQGPRFAGEEKRCGRVIRASYGEGVVILLDNGKEFRLPPDLSLLQPAPPTGPAAGQPPPSPDLLTQWTVVRAAEDDDA